MNVYLMYVSTLFMSLFPSFTLMDCQGLVLFSQYMLSHNAINMGMIV